MLNMDIWLEFEVSIGLLGLMDQLPIKIMGVVELGWSPTSPSPAPAPEFQEYIKLLVSNIHKEIIMHSLLGAIEN